MGFFLVSLSVEIYFWRKIMKKLSELLKEEERVRFLIDDENKKDFLNFATQYGCKWVGGEEININEDKCGYIMDIDRTLSIGRIGTTCAFMGKNQPIKINFADYLAENSEVVTSESVNIGHPDKTCDMIADAFLDEALRQDPMSQMAVECAIKDNKLFVFGEATTKAEIDYDNIARKVLKDIGYQCHFDIIKQISKQSVDIHNAVVTEEVGANDQGMVFGYATDETPEFMPLSIVIAHKLMREYEAFRQQNKGYFADAKSQVTVQYLDGRPIKILTVLVSVSHAEDILQEQIINAIKENVVDKVLCNYSQYVQDVDIIINPSGRFTIWGSFGDSGCVGRKIVVDSYGGVGRVGGGCFSSKNATKVDRSGAYYARYVAKNIVAHGLCHKCEVQVAYGIGLSQPIAININTFGTEQKPLGQIQKYVKNNFDFSPKNIIKELDLLKPIYFQTASYGHFGRNEFSWEKIKD